MNTNLHSTLIKKLTLAAALTIGIFACQPNSDAASTPPGVTTKTAVRYHIKMRTKVVVPSTGPQCKRIRVWQALPTTKPWSKVTSVPGVTALSYVPRTGKLEMEKDGLSAHVLFDESRLFRPGEVRQFQSEFYVFSCDRDFDPGSRAVSWSRYTANDRIGAEKPPRVIPEVAVIADQLKSNRNPVDFVLEASKWIRNELAYDAGVNYVSDDATAIMKYRRGHCGHQQAIFKQMCARAGIPYKPVLGLFLHAADGKDNLSNVRADYTNNHTWCQVRFPDIGWVEVDPGTGADCYKIPSTLIENNTAFENYSVWITEQGRPSRIPAWVPAGAGKFVNEYGLENTITFSQ
jgi:transglutaminase-like putative cysteine protease